MSTPTVQGLAGEPAAPLWPALTVPELHRVLTEFGLREPITIRWHSPRPWTAAAIAGTAGPTVFVKRHDVRVRDRAGLVAEHAFVKYLRHNGFSTPRPLATGAGDTVVEDDRWAYEVLELAVGDDRYRDRYSWTPYLSVSDARAAGAMLADLHAKAEGYDAPPILEPRPLSNPLRLLHCADLVDAARTYAAQRPALTAFLADRPWESELECLRAPHARLLPTLATQRPLWGHGDWHGSNLLWNGSTPVAAIDFGLADRTCAAFDVATAIERAAISWLSLVQGGEPSVAFDQVDAVLDGYATVHRIDHAAVAAFLPLVHVELALSELDHFTRVVPRVDDAELAYRYLVDHARWFARGGRQLTDHIHSKSTTPIER